MKIVFLIDTMLTGGAQKVLLSHAHYLSNQNHDITVVSFKKSNKHDIDDSIRYLELIELDEQITTKMFYILQELSSIAQLSDIVIGFSDFAVNYITFLLGKLYDKPTLICVRNLLSELVKDYYEDMLQINHDILGSIFKSSMVMVQSEAIKQDLIQQFNANSKNIEILHNPIGKYDNIPDLNKDENYFVIVGRLTKQKNLPLVLEAFSLLRQKIKTDIKLRFIGDGEELPRLVERVHQLNIQDYVVFQGYEKNVLPYIRGAKLMILASTYEGLPNVILEAFSQKTPVLASDIEPTKEVVKDKITGILFKNNNMFDLAEKMEYCLLKNLNDYIDNAYKSLEKYHNVHKDFEKLLENIIGKQNECKK